MRPSHNDFPSRTAKGLVVLRLSTIRILAIGFATVAMLAGCGKVVRYPNADPAAPTSRSVEVQAGVGLVFISGQTPQVAAPQAEKFSVAYWGDTEAQTRTVFDKIEAQLKSVGLGLGDVVKLQVFLVGDPALQGRADAAGFAKAYAARFGTVAQPERPARTTVQVAALGQPGMLVEIDVIAARR